jgi:hypothetical protein
MIMLIVMLGSGCASEGEITSSDTLQVRTCHAQTGDLYRLGNLSVQHGVLLAEVQTDDGCGSFTACWSGFVLDTYPGEVILELSHDSHADTCAPILTQELRIDLSPVLAHAGLPLQISVVGATGQLAGTTNTVRLNE